MTCANNEIINLIANFIFKALKSRFKCPFSALETPCQLLTCCAGLVTHRLHPPQLQTAPSSAMYITQTAPSSATDCTLLSYRLHPPQLQTPPSSATYITQTPPSSATDCTLLSYIYHTDCTLLSYRLHPSQLRISCVELYVVNLTQVESAPAHSGSLVITCSVPHCAHSICMSVINLTCTASFTIMLHYFICLFAPACSPCPCVLCVHLSFLSCMHDSIMLSTRY